jgi:hypothetical protein
MYPVSRGVDADGVAKAITVAETNASSNVVLYTATAGVTSPSVDYGTNTTVGSRTESTLKTATLSLPNGNSKTFELNVVDRVTQGVFQLTSPGISTPVSGSASISVKNGTLTVIYADPSIPLVVYEYYYTTSVSSGSAVDPASPSFATNVITSFVDGAVQEVGILVGDTQRVLFTNIATDIVGAGSQAVAGYRGADTTALEATSHSDETVNLNNPYAPNLKRSVDGFLGGEFSFSAKDAGTWAMSASRSVDMDSNAETAFDMYASSADEATVKQAYVDYLVRVINALFSAALDAGTATANYESFLADLAAQAKIDVWLTAETDGLTALNAQDPPDLVAIAAKASRVARYQAVSDLKSANGYPTPYLTPYYLLAGLYAVV